MLADWLRIGIRPRIREDVGRDGVEFILNRLVREAVTCLVPETGQGVFRRRIKGADLLMELSFGLELAESRMALYMEFSDLRS